MKNTSLIIPFQIKTKCLYCESEIKVDLQNILAVKEDDLRYVCEQCKKTANLLDDNEFVELVGNIIENKNEFKDWFAQAMAEIIVHFLETNELDIDEEITSEFRKLPKEELKKAIAELLLGKKSAAA